MITEFIQQLIYGVLWFYGLAMGTIAGIVGATPMLVLFACIVIVFGIAVRASYYAIGEAIIIGTIRYLKKMKELAPWSKKDKKILKKGKRTQKSEAK